MARAIDDPVATCTRVFSSQVFSAMTRRFAFSCRATRRSLALLPRISTSIWYSSAIRLSSSVAIGAGGDLARSNHCQPNPGARRQAVHRSCSITCRSVSQLTSPRRRTRAPRPNTISMTPSRSVRRGRPSSAAISTGIMAPLSTTAFGNSCRRHLNSWLLFTSWRRATTDIDAPGTSVSATICRFNASEYCRRFATPGCCLVSTKPLVDTCSDRSAIHRSLSQSALSGRRSSRSAYR